MKTNTCRHSRPKKKKKHQSVSKKTNVNQKFPRCFKETSGQRLLRHLSDYLHLNINIWKNNKIIKKILSQSLTYILDQWKHTIHLMQLYHNNTKVKYS